MARPEPEDSDNLDAWFPRDGQANGNGTHRNVQSQAEEVFEDHDRDGAVHALAGRVAQDDAGVAGIELLVDFEPESNRDPTREGADQYQSLVLNRQVKFVVQVQDSACPVGGFEGHGHQKDVRQAKQNTGFTMPAEHPDSA